ncbi:RHS repeat-associated core domain-containing protein [Candidatus Binatia bacterium]|nr:RHS repeat-associated core domain-containing protein [Candidatus Binatia bacterium]
MAVVPTIGPSISAKSATSADFRAGGAAALYDYGARFYDPQLVQFVSQDPVREYVQAYAYVGWNPVRWTDPTGMLTVPDAGGASGLNFLGGFTVTGGIVSTVSIGDLVSARDFAGTLAMRGLGKGMGGKPGGLALLLQGLPGFLKSTGMSSADASASAGFLARIGYESIAGRNLGSVPGATAALSVLSQAASGTGPAAEALAWIGLFSLPGGPEILAAVSELVQIVATVPNPFPGPAVGLDVLAFGLTQVGVNQAYASNQISQGAFTFYSELNLIGAGTGIVAAFSGGNPAGMLAATGVQLAVFTAIAAGIGPGPVMSTVLETVQ